MLTPMEFSPPVCKENIDLLFAKLALYWPLLFTESHIIVCVCVCVCVCKGEERSDCLNI